MIREFLNRFRKPAKKEFTREQKLEILQAVSKFAAGKPAKAEFFRGIDRPHGATEADVVECIHWFNMEKQSLKAIVDDARKTHVATVEMVGSANARMKLASRRIFGKRNDGSKNKRKAEKQARRKNR